MRVTAGKFKGRVLVPNKYEHIRPTADVVKQAIFNKINFHLEGAAVLDLFCGTGALGIEAMSRGAEEVIFVDKDFRSVMLTKQNLLKLGANAEVIKSDYQNALKYFKAKAKRFDIILLDPPYQSGVYENCFKLISELDLLKEGGLIVSEQNKDLQFDFAPFKVADEKIYGIKKVVYLEKAD